MNCQTLKRTILKVQSHKSHNYLFVLFNISQGPQFCLNMKICQLSSHKNINMIIKNKNYALQTYSLVYHNLKHVQILISLSNNFRETHKKWKP